MKIYVAGPYSAQTEEGRVANMMTAIDIGIELMRKGHEPYIPHLTHYMMKRALEKNYVLGDVDDGIWHSFWLNQDHQWLKVCDALYYIGPSKGADMELEWAMGLGFPIYTSLDSVP